MNRELIAAIDLGSNSFRLQIGRIVNDQIYPLDGIKEAVRLAAGLSPDGVLPETVERPDHPWFIGVQYHPELKSRPFAPHPLFASFIGAAVVQSRLV